MRELPHIAPRSNVRRTAPRAEWIRVICQWRPTVNRKRRNNYVGAGVSLALTCSALAAAADQGYSVAACMLALARLRVVACMLALARLRVVACMSTLAGCRVVAHHSTDRQWAQPSPTWSRHCASARLTQE
jgi:hypothetical protein